MKVKFISRISLNTAEREINEFIADKDVIDIRDMHNCNCFMIIYREKEEHEFAGIGLCKTCIFEEAHRSECTGPCRYCHGEQWVRKED